MKDPEFMRLPKPVTMTAALLCVGTLSAPAAHASPADDEALRREFDEKLRRALDEQDARHRAEIDSLRAKIAAVPAVPTEMQDRIDHLVLQMGEMRADAARPERRGPLRHDTLRHDAVRHDAVRLLDVSLNVLTVAGTSSGTEAEIQALNQGGHDPKKRGFTMPNAELIVSGAVDPYFRGQASIVTLLSPEGETEVELEEAFATTTALPHGLQVKAGQFFTAFGRHNQQHPHEWDFVNAPVANARILGGDGLRGPGAQVSWLAPDLPLELTWSMQNANGETAISFLGTGEDAPPAGRFVEREVRSLHDTLQVGRAAFSVDAIDEIPVLFGVSGAFGPSGASTGGDARVLGADVSFRWKPLGHESEFPFVAVRGEFIARRYELDTRAGTDELEDSGFYAQALWGFRRDWTLGVRYDRFHGDFGGRVPGLDDRTRMSGALTWHTSESSKIRLQVDRDDAKSMRGDVTSVWLQLEFNLGAHAEHRRAVRGRGQEMEDAESHDDHDHGTH
jgi:hypothetical protein